MTARFVKRPVVVEAMQLTDANGDEVVDGFMRGTDAGYDIVAEKVWIRTREGVMTADIGDYVIREPFPTDDRRYYPCKADLFEATYAAVEEGTS